MRVTRHVSRVLLPFALPLFLLAGACTSVPQTDSDPYSQRTVAEPDWRWMPHSWEKLSVIQTWLVGAGPRIHPELVAEAELMLAEGRLRFAQEEAAVVPASTIRTRVAAAESGLRRVLSDPFADESIRSRARQALGEIGGVRATPRTDSPVAVHVQARSAWGARAANPRRLTPATGRWTRITVHHSAQNASSLRRGPQSASGSDIAGHQRYHMNNNGWGDIGYHYLIDPQGRIFAGRSLKWQGAHADGMNNVENIGVCLLGNFDEERPSAQAVASMQSLLTDLRGRFGIPLRGIKQHSEFKNTECPGTYLSPFVLRYRRGQTGASAAPARRANLQAGTRQATMPVTVAARPMRAATPLRRTAG
ncbi:MAG: hypothetical protein ACI8PQ_003058, partial [Planctomycetota bacterium]